MDVADNQIDTSRPLAPTRNVDVVSLIGVMRMVTEVLWSADFQSRVIESRVIPNSDPAEAARQRQAALEDLDELRSHLTLHAHSQGARIAAAARTRLGTVPGLTDGAVEEVLPKWDLVTYGSGAGLSMWWHPSQFRRTLHHVNQKDYVPNTFGFNPAFKLSLDEPIRWSINFGSQWLGVDFGGGTLLPLSKEPDSFVWRLNGIPGGSTGVRVARYANAKSAMKAHTFIVYPSRNAGSNWGEHDFGNGYLCHVSLDPWAVAASLPVSPDYPAHTGPEACAGAQPPSIVKNPADQVVPVGQGGVFSVDAEVKGQIGYQWMRNGVAIPGATATSYATPPVTLADDGARFSVVVSNGNGKVSSNEARLWVVAK